MKKEIISEALNDISENYIAEAAEYRKKSIIKIAAAVSAAVLALVVGVIIIAGRGNEPKMLSQSDSSYGICINTDDISMAMADMDIQIEWYEIENISDEVKQSFEDRVGESPEEFFSRLPENFTVTKLWSYLARHDENGVRHEEYRPYDYRMEIKSPAGGRIRLAVCCKDNPLRDCIIVCDNARPSYINDTELYIYKFGESYFTCFESGGKYYDIEGESISEEELVKLISSLTTENE